jgi:DNA (cytosine-5)-methyltransferase 1
MIKVLNLYAGIGGNRKLWEDVDVTAVEINPEIAKIYQDFFPDDKVIVTDAHRYLLEHFKEFDFIWSSPPCPSHSVTNHFLHAQGVIRYPDMALWQEIIFLKTWFYKKWVVENVKSYYEPLYRAQELERHYFWANFYISMFKTNRKFNIANARTTTRMDNKKYDNSLESYIGFKLPKETKDKRLLLRNCVLPELGKHIFDCAFANKDIVNYTNQLLLVGGE